jgi:hypothetical protein
LTLSLKLPHISGEDSDVMAFKDVEQRPDFQSWVRFVWENVLGKLLDRRSEQAEKEWAAIPGA